MLHVTQKNILNVLATAESRRYRELKPDAIDGNVFGYHLKQLLSSGLIRKTSEGSYCLTEVGRKYIVTRYERPLESAHSIFLLVITSGEEYLVRERKIQPMLGTKGFVHGEPKLHMPLTESARARLLAKTGIDINLSVATSGLITIKKGGELQSYSHATVLTGDVGNKELPLEADATGHNLWVHANELNKAEFIPSCQDILQALQRRQTWFELSYDI